MSRSSIILRNVASNWLGFAVNAAVTLVLTPYVMKELGPARYGIWILTSSIIGYYGFLDLGFRAGVTQYLTRYLAAGEHDKASQCLSGAVAVLASLGTLMLGLSVGAAYLAPQLFTMPEAAADEAFWCILIVGCAAAVQFALQPFTSVFTATQRFDLANLVAISMRILGAAGMVATLKMEQGLIGVSAVTCTVSAADYIIRWRIARALVPQLRVSWRHTNFSQLREMGSFGAWNFLVSINSFVYQHVPNLLIGTTMPIAAVGHYALATGLTRQVNAVLTPVPQVLYPAATELHVRGDRAGLERLYHDGTRLMLIILTSVVLMAGFWAHDFYRLWIGEKYLSGVPFHSVAILFQILLISVVTNYSSTIATQILTGIGRIRTVAVALMCGSLLSLAGSFALIGTYGLAGVAAAVVFASVVIDFIAIPVLLQRILGLSAIRLVQRAWGRPVAVGVLQAAIYASLRLAGRPDHWVQLITYGVVGGIGAAAVVLGVGINAEERRRFVVNPLQRLFRGGGLPREVISS